MKKSNREIIFDKYGGRCAYCGCELEKFQIDHLIPKMNYRYNLNKIPDAFKDIPDFGCNHMDNLMPSCGSCNNYKNTMDIETFREQIGLLVGRLNSTFTQYKIAKRFGLIEETQKSVTFYFETFNKLV